MISAASLTQETPAIKARKRGDSLCIKNTAVSL